KDQPLFIGRDANTAVDHRQFDTQSLFVHPFAVRQQLHGAGEGELERIAQQIDDDLPEARGIDHQPYVVQLVVDLAVQRELLLLRCKLEGIDDLRQQRGDIGVDRFQLQQPALDTREVENIVDDGQQVLRRVDGDTHILRLLRIQL